jgi:hypothetical protein
MSYYENVFDATPGLVARGEGDRQGLMRKETEDFLRAVSEDYPSRAAEYWHRDYYSLDAYLASVAPNRQRWLEAVGDFGSPSVGDFGSPSVGDFGSPSTPDMTPLLEPFAENEHFRAEWVTINLSGEPGGRGNLRGRGVLALPKMGQPPYPLVVAQHGIGSSPERVFGFGDDGGLYHAYGQRLVEAGYAVLAPFNVTEGPPRERLTRLCLMLGKTLWGLEIHKISRLLDYCATRPEVDMARVGMWGISLGGAYTIFTMPLEPRITVGICTAWFNHRVKKMVIDDPRYSCFLSTNEGHIFIPGWLREFTDSDLVSLICPRPFMSQTGKADGIAWWPFAQEEFDQARDHYAKLGLEADRLEFDLHEAGHEIRVASGLRFLGKWLGKA